jgi:hypothetical protein
LRPALGRSRQEFDDGLRKLRIAGRYSACDGEKNLSAADIEASIEEHGRLLLYVVRRDEQ